MSGDGKGEVSPAVPASWEHVFSWFALVSGGRMKAPTGRDAALHHSEVRFGTGRRHHMRLHMYI